MLLALRWVYDRGVRANRLLELCLDWLLLHWILLGLVNGLSLSNRGHVGRDILGKVAAACGDVPSIIIQADGALINLLDFRELRLLL